MEMKPIGYMQSVFKYKNGTPRQPMLCENSRGILRIEKSIFNNPEHSLEELDQFSHVWILFIFHKNSSSVTKAKVKPPRLDGRRVGVFSTRSPHRPNPIGLTLARLDKVEGSCVYLSGIDILDGTPVLDVKPYIQEYDTPLWKPGNQSSNIACPKTTDIDKRTKDLVPDPTEMVLPTEGPVWRKEENGNMESDKTCSNDSRLNENSQKTITFGQIPSSDKLNVYEGTDRDTSKRQGRCAETNRNKSEGVCVQEGVGENHIQQKGTLAYAHSYMKSAVSSSNSVSTDKEIQLPDTDCLEELNQTTNNRAATENISSSWVPEINRKLCVRFTERSESQLKLFSKHSLQSQYELRLIGDCSQLRQSIISILSEDPRSVYRRHKCQDSLYYFTVDRAHVTCWFDGNTAEIVRIQSINMVKELLPYD